MHRTDLVRSREPIRHRSSAVPTGERPRERLAEFGPVALTDAELLALLVRTGTGGRGALDVARDTLLAAEGLRVLASAPVAELESLPGLGPVKAATLVAAFELGRRVATQKLERGVALSSPQDVHRHFAPRLRDEPCEHFLAVLLDGRHRVLGDVAVSRGTLTSSLVHPREVFRPAIRQAAAAVVLVHNHPSGDPAPSLEDRRVTVRLREAGELVGIRVVDHVIVAEGGYHSFEEEGELS